mgnify:CR=1 FL=1
MVDQLNSAKSDSLPSQFSSDLPTDSRSTSKQAMAKPSKPMSLKRKATAIAVVLGTLPVLAVGAASYYLADQALSQSIINSQKLAATRLSDLVSRYMSERYADIQVLANLPVFTDAQRSEALVNERAATLDRIYQAYRFYSNLAILDLDGRAIAQVGKPNQNNPSFQTFFREAVKANRALISPAILSPETKAYEVYFTAPIRDSQSGRTIAMIRATLPLERLSEPLQVYTLIGREYSLVDPANQVILSSQANRVNQSAIENFPTFSAMQSEQQLTTRFSVDPRSRSQYVFTYIPWTKLEGLPDLNWQVMLGNNVENAFAARRNLLLTVGIGTTIAALLVGWASAVAAGRLTRRIIGVSRAVQKLGQGYLDTRIKVKGEDEIALLGDNINYMASQLQKLVFEQVESSQKLERLNEATFNIRKTLDFNIILQTAVAEARRLLNSDRAMVYLFDEHWQGRIVAESVALEFPPALGAEVCDPCFAQKFVDKYQQGRVHLIPNLDEADLDPCYRGQLEQFHVKANMVAPMLVDNKLIGLLVVHQCSAPRVWDVAEVNLFTQIAVHLGDALEQVTLTEQRQRTSQAETLAAERQRYQESMEMQLLELLRHAEKAAMGDLTVRAAVGAGEIGTVADFFNSIVENLQQIVSQVKQTAMQVNASLGSHEFAVRSLSQDALRQADETAATLDSVQAMMKTIETVAQSAQQAAEVSRSASLTAETGGQAMDLTVQQILGLRQTIGDTAKKVKRLGESSQQISKVVSLINQITVQTNLLAINAGIEAARAGEESQGIAAIAEEVGALAARAADATREIEQLVADIQRETSEVVQSMEQGTTQVVEGTHFVEQAKHSLEEIIAVSHQIDHLVQSISEATVSQVETSQQITHLMKDIAQIAERTSGSSIEVSDSLRETVAVARELQDSVGTFKVN